MFIAQVLVGPSKQLKQITQTKHNIVKNPNWPEANQLAIYKRGWGFELGATEKQIQVVVRAGLEPGTARLWVWHADNSTMLPPTEGKTPFWGFVVNVIKIIVQCISTMYGPVQMLLHSYDKPNSMSLT